MQLNTSETSEPVEAKTLTCQGRLSDIYGKPLTGEYEVAFALYNLEASDEPIWAETQNVSIHEGLFLVNLGEINPIILPFGPDYWLGITVGTEELLPRYKLASLGAAYRLDAGEYSEGEYTILDNMNLTGSDISQDVVLGGEKRYLTSRTQDDEELNQIEDKQITNIPRTTSTSRNYDMQLMSMSFTPPTNAKKEWVVSAGAKEDVVISAINQQTTGENYGVWAEINSPSGAGVMGLSNATTGDAVGVAGISKSTEATGVYGEGKTSGVHGKSTGIGLNDAGIYGEGGRYGVEGTNATMAGVYGKMDVSIGVLGELTQHGIGVCG